MIRPVCRLALVLVVGVGWATLALGQVGAPNRPPPNSPPQRPPSPEEILRLFLPPEEEADDSQPYYAQRGETVPVRPPRLRVPTTSEAAQWTPQQQRAFLRQALALLDEELDRWSTGASWKEFLHTGDLGSALWCRPESEPDPDAVTLRTLRTVADKFARVQQQPRYAAVHSLVGFQATRAVLPEYALGAYGRGQRELRASVAQLSGALARLNTGAHWKEYLQVEEIQRRAGQVGEPQPADRDVLAALVARFDEVEKNAQYRKVAAASGFTGARDALHRMVASLPQVSGDLPRRGDGPAPTRAPGLALQRTVLSLKEDLDTLRHDCGEEAAAHQSAAAATLMLVDAKPGERDELERRAKSANDVLRAIHERREQRQRAADSKVLYLIKSLQAGETKEENGRTILILPLGVDDAPDDSAYILPLGGEQKPPAATLLPLGTDPNKPKSPPADDSSSPKEPK